MPNANRTLADGQVVLVDGTYSAILNIHGTVNDWPADGLDEARAAADEQARLAFYSRIEGEWTLSIDRTLELSMDHPVGQITTPITVLIAKEGEFQVSARGIDVGNGTIELAVDVAGRIDAKTIIHNDRLMFEAKIVNVDASNCTLTVAGFSIPGVEEMIEGFLKLFQKPQRIEFIRPDLQREEMHIVADPTLTSKEMTQVLERRRPWQSHYLNKPVFVSQRSLHLCWAAAIASISRTLKLANKPQSITTPFPLPTSDPFPEFTIEKIVEKVRNNGKAAKKNWFHGDNFDPNRPPNKAPNNDTDRLMLQHDETDWKEICWMFRLPTPTIYPATDGKFAVAGAKGLTVEDVKFQIDQGRYGLMAFSEPVWITDKEPNPTWHVVVVFGYNLDKPAKILVLDPNSSIVAAKLISPNFKYFLTWKAADTWDEDNQQWVEDVRKPK